MKTLCIVTAAALLLFVVGFTHQTALPVYEYKYEHSPTEKKTNELGAQGWELVAIQSPSPNILASTYVFKRRK